jgi:hypothetical protein
MVMNFISSAFRRTPTDANNSGPMGGPWSNKETNMNRICYVAALSLIGTSMLASNGFADDAHTGTNTAKDAKIAKPDAGMSVAETAGKLAQWARDNKDPVELAAAARLLASDPPRDLPDAANKKKSESKTPAEGAPPESPAFTSAELLKEARDMAKDNKEELTAIDEIEKTMPETRGHPGGAVVDHDVLLPGGSMTYTITFTGGDPMEIAVFANGNGVVDWHVYDESGNEITSQASDHFVNTPRWTGPFKIVLTNNTNGYLPYSLATN